MYKTNYGERLTHKLIKKIFKYTIIYTLSLILLWFILSFICSNIIWYSDDVFYQILKTVGYNPIYMLIIWFIGFSILASFCLKKTLNYIDLMIDATEMLIKNDDEKICLPSELAEIEDKMNQIKEKSKKNYELAKENEKKKNDLIIYLAHDIKTPLTVVIGYLSLLEEISDMPLKQRKKYISMALDKSYQLEELINELFDIAKFDSGSIILEKEKINLNIMLSQIIDDFYPILKDLDKKIIFNADEKIEIIGDSDKLARVFNNVIKNAINYSYDKTNIEVEIKKKDKWGYVMIKNKGKKIPKENLKKIFEKFYRLDNSRNRNTGGSGLGLAISKEIVKAHGGNISAKSDENETCFKIKLPF